VDKCRPAVVRQGEAWRGAARQGVAGQGTVRHGVARRGAAWRDNDMTKRPP